jgi:hypothetical protein
VKFPSTTLLVLMGLGIVVLFAGGCSPPPLSSVDWYAERGCAGCDHALAVAVEYVQKEHDGVRPEVVCPDPEGWIVIVSPGGPFGAEHCRAVLVTTSGEVGYKHKAPICQAWRDKQECSPVTSERRAEP